MALTITEPLIDNTHEIIISGAQKRIIDELEKELTYNVATARRAGSPLISLLSQNNVSPVIRRQVLGRFYDVILGREMGL